jgi:hypothetical protein
MTTFIVMIRLYSVRTAKLYNKKEIVSIMYRLNTENAGGGFKPDKSEFIIKVTSHDERAL